MRSCQSGWARGHGRERVDQQVEALLRVQPAGGHDHLGVGVGEPAGQRRERVRDADEAGGRAGQQRAVVALVARGEHGEGVEPAVVAADLPRDPRQVRAEVHVLLADDGERPRSRPRGEQVEAGPRGDQHAAAQAAQPAGELQVGVRAAVGEADGRRGGRARSAAGSGSGAPARRGRGRGGGRRARSRSRRAGTAKNGASRPRYRLMISTGRGGRELLGQAQRGADRPAHAVGVAEQDVHAARARRRPAAASAGARPAPRPGRRWRGAARARAAAASGAGGR